MKQIQGLPELLITLGRNRLTATESASVAWIQIKAALAQPAQCNITWVSMDSRPGHRVDPAPGDALRVEVAGVRRPLFAGEVTVVEHSYGADLSEEVRVRAYDALHRLRKRQFTRMHDDVDLNGLATALCEGTGLSVIGGSGRRGRVYQVARSDLSLLLEASAAEGLYPVVDDSALRLVSLQGDGDPIELELGSSLHSAELEVSQEPAFLSAAVAGWNPVSASAFRGDSDDNRARADVRADAAPQSVGGGGPLLRHNEAVDADPVATDLAQAELDVRAAREVTGVFVADGDPRVRAGGRVRIRGVAASLEGTFTVCSVVHEIGGAGYETTISTQPPATPSHRAADVTTLGIVVDVNDPEQRARVQVELPAYPDIVSDWAPVLVAGAGTGKGAVLLPNAGDTVLVLLVAGKPTDAIVLGGLYGPERVPDADVDGERGRRFTISTADGQQIVLNGSARSIRLADGHGSVIELGPDLLSISSATDMLLEAPGRSLRIRASSVDFEEAK
jgi:phage baseplate assembly protein V